MASVKPAPPIPANVMPATWNTQALGPRLACDMTAALCASTLVAPLITLIDKSIILRTHTPSPLLTIFTSNLRQALRHPVSFFTTAPFILINTLYFATYTTANLTDTVASTLRDKPASAVTSGPAKFFATSATNLSVCMYKDARFAKMFGAGAAQAARSTAPRAARAVPLASLALFATRDSMTMFASFNVPAVLGPVIGSAAVAQFLAPASIQLFSTPLHLLGLDLYNRPHHGAPGPPPVWSDRLAVVRRDWLQASLGRIGRIVPAYGLGGVVNTGVRRRLMQALE